jgi:hypothetical protein
VCELHLGFASLGRHARGGGQNDSDWVPQEKVLMVQMPSVQCDLQAKVHGEMSN